MNFSQNQTFNIGREKQETLNSYDIRIIKKKLNLYSSKNKREEITNLNYNANDVETSQPSSAPFLRERPDMESGHSFRQHRNFSSQRQPPMELDGHGHLLQANRRHTWMARLRTVTKRTNGQLRHCSGLEQPLNWPAPIRRLQQPTIQRFPRHPSRLAGAVLQPRQWLHDRDLHQKACHCASAGTARRRERYQCWSNQLCYLGLWKQLRYVIRQLA